MNFLTTSLSEDGVVRIALNRPPVNAVHGEMYRELATLFEDIDQIGPNVRSVVLSAKGPHFSAGNDLDEFASMAPSNASDRMWRVRRAFAAISGCAVPVIGAVHGVALGTGLAIAASCDFVVASRTAKFGLPELSVGVMGGARHLARMAPPPLVRRMYLTGEHLTASDFAGAGGAITVCDPDHLAREATRLAERVVSFSPTAVRVSKRVLDRIESMELQEGYRLEQAATERMSGHPDSKEALAAFREKRAPQYKPLSRDVCWYGA